VGTPQPGGIDYYFATDILEALFLDSNARVKGVDMVELVPEPSSVSQTFAANLLQKVISYWGISQGFDKKEKSGSQMEISYE
jgi:arginase family enzyme